MSAIALPARPMFVVFEGLDGTGKSSLARGLAQAWGAVHLRTPTEALAASRSAVVAALQGAPEAAQLYYMATVVQAAAEARAALAAGRHVVLERYYVSTEAYARFRGSQLSLCGVLPRLLPPDATVHVRAPLAVRQSRMGGRGICTDEDAQTLSASADAVLLAEHTTLLQLPFCGRVLEFENLDGALGPAVAHLAERLVGADEFTTRTKQIVR